MIKSFEVSEGPWININIAKINSNYNLRYIHSNKIDQTIRILFLVSGKWHLLLDLSPPSNA
jgi:hypothetical protein